MVLSRWVACLVSFQSEWWWSRAVHGEEGAQASDVPAGGADVGAGIEFAHEALEDSGAQLGSAQASQPGAERLGPRQMKAWSRARSGRRAR
jgi:hypothetical protein